MKNKLIYNFKLVVDRFEGSVREFAYDTNGSAFLKWELVGFGMDRYWYVRAHNPTHGLVPIHAFWDHLNRFSNMKSITAHLRSHTVAACFQ